MTSDQAEVGFQPVTRPSNPGRRRVLARAGLALVLVAAVVAGGAYWKVQAPERARHRYEKQLVGAEAAWPAVQARIAALPLPAGWVEDPTGTACSPQAGPTTRCLVTNARDEQQAMQGAAAMLRRAGASDHDPLMSAFKATVGSDGSHLGGCTSVVSVCEISLGWDGASVQVTAVAGSDLVDQPVVVLLSRGIAYPQLPFPIPTDAPLPDGVKALGQLAGVTSALGPATCARRTKTGSGCQSWRVLVSSPRPIAEVQGDLARALASHGFRIEARLPNDNAYFKHVIARLNRGPRAEDPVVAVVGLRVNPSGDGTTIGSVVISSEAVYYG